MKINKNEASHHQTLKNIYILSIGARKKVIFYNFISGSSNYYPLGILTSYQYLLEEAQCSMIIIIL
jgi:hypothetical protein